MKRIECESDFQRWVQGALSPVGHVQDHRLSGQPNIPDLSAAVRGQDLWLELKFDRIRLGHDKYSDFEFSEYRAGQSAWLEDRAIAGRSVCGFLGYLNTGGTIDYICFTTPEAYRGWKGETVGAVLLSEMACIFNPAMDGASLLRFVLEARRRCWSRPTP